MSRETNSMLLRYGINTFWSNSISTSRALYSKEQFNAFFILFFNNHFLQPLKIQYKYNCIIIYVYYYKEEKLSFLQKFILWKKLELNKLLSRKNFNVFSNSISKINKKTKISNILILLINKQLECKLLHNELKNKYQKKKDSNFLSILKYPLKTKSVFWNKNISLKKKFRLKIINNILKLKWLSIFCSCILNLYNTENYKIILKSALEKISTTKLPFFFRYMKFNLLKKKMYIIFTGLLFFKSFIINIYISNIIKKTKNKKHVKNLIIFLNIIKIMFEKQIIPFSGFKFIISGRLNGKLRKGSFGFKVGSIKLMSYNIATNYSCDTVYTQYGSFSLKLWLCDNSTL